MRDPDIHGRFGQIVIVQCVCTVSDPAYRNELESQFANDPLVKKQALLQLTYLPTWHMLCGSMAMGRPGQVQRQSRSA